ncbi:AraC family transcriptional regulator [Chitinophaga dinghuensis]|uniref:AraC family transcriptional regulator n=1 Tax=Chitinophaga dinghuensis TaxID=1539050 RepID=A0A327VUJ6_9BACT|nr:AraC family transcriptional regulator [Chitinophaga dinghuensis]RAJ78943.1 AraC family transcriptional regulator [Chitinophaga dinghuensis]
MNGNRSVNLDCVYNVLHLIEQHYDQDISIKQLEGASHYSYRNIQRIFKYTCGETIGAYQKRLRLENAYKLMLYTNDSITNIALKVGFESLASFSKAFKEHFHCAPKEAKLSKTLLFSDAGIAPVESEIYLQPEIIYFPAVKVYYESAFIPYENTRIEQLWEQFLQNEFPASSTTYYGIIADDPLITAELKCRYDACSSEQSRNRILPSKVILGGRYAQFIHTGTYETIEETYKNIYAGWILDSDLEFAHTPIVEHYIRHPDNSDVIEDQLTGILLPLK